MTKRIFCKQAYVLDEIRLNMSYSKAVPMAVLGVGYYREQTLVH